MGEPIIYPEGLADVARLEQAFRRGLRPDPIQSVSEWSAEHRILSGEAASMPGKWRNERTPFLVEIMESLSPSSRVEEVCFMKPVQIGGSEMANNWIGYIVARGLGPTLCVQKTAKHAERYSKVRLDPMFRDTVCLHRKIGSRRRKDSGNTILQKTFPGGVLTMAGSESASGLRSMPIRNLFLDEVDAYPPDVEGEGDPCELAERRTTTFARRKVFKVSTPTDALTSRIEHAFKKSDQRYYFVPCPECGHEQRLIWKNLKYEHDGGKVLMGSVGYACEECGVLIREHQKPAMLRAGKWRPTAEEPTGLRRGYHLSALYSPWVKWWAVADKFLDATYPRTHVPRLKSWVNTFLAETWKEKAGSKPDWKRLLGRCELIEFGVVPAAATFITAGVDVQRDRLEIEVVAWGKGAQSWGLEYVVLDGDPAGTEVWDQLEAFFRRTWRHESGVELSILKMAIDSSDQTGLVYTRARQFPRDRTMVVKGASDAAADLVGRPKTMDINWNGKKVRRGILLWRVGVSLGKHEIYAWLGLKAPEEGEPYPDGYCHYPVADCYDRDYFRSLTAEEWVQEEDKRTGRLKSRWKKVRERNEALDLRVYARVAASVVGLDRWTDEDWAVARASSGLTSKRAAPSGREKSSGRIRPSGYLDSVRRPRRS